MSDASNQGISTLTGTALPYPHDNVDTDQILPKQFLTRITKEGYGQFLFNDLRYFDGELNNDNPDFVLNDPKYKGASILLAGANFGCGSSREHAPWAIGDYGFKVVMASSFADIFYSNCINNQILPIQLTDNEMRLIFEMVDIRPDIEIQVDLAAQIVELGDYSFSFNIAENHKNSLLKGQDKIDAVLDIADKIRAFEQTIPAWRQ